MLNYSKSTNYNGESRGKLNEGEVIAATMSGTVNDDETFTFNSYISNREAYNANKAEVQGDIEAFQELLYGSGE